MTTQPERTSMRSTRRLMLFTAMGLLSFAMGRTCEAIPAQLVHVYINPPDPYVSTWIVRIPGNGPVSALDISDPITPPGAATWEAKMIPSISSTTGNQTIAIEYCHLRAPFCNGPGNPPFRFVIGGAAPYLFLDRLAETGGDYVSLLPQPPVRLPHDKRFDTYDVQYRKHDGAIFIKVKANHVPDVAATGGLLLAALLPIALRASRHGWRPRA